MVEGANNLKEITKGIPKPEKMVSVLRCSYSYALYLSAGLEIETDYKGAKIFVDDPDNIKYMEIHLLKETTTDSYSLIRLKGRKSPCFMIKTKIARKLAEQGKNKSKKIERLNNVIRIWW